VPRPSEVYEFLGRLEDARVSQSVAKRLISAEDDSACVVAEEKNRLQLDLLFFESDPNYFRPALYVSGMVPSRFRELFDAKESVEKHPWCDATSPNAFSGPFTFGDFHVILYSRHEEFSDEFLGLTRCALEKRQVDRGRLVATAMQLVHNEYLAAGDWVRRVAKLFRTLLFFESLTSKNGDAKEMLVDYGESDQAERVRLLFARAPGRLCHDAAAQAAFLIGAASGRIEDIQSHARGSSSFGSRLKGFHLNERELKDLFRYAKEKSAAYGEDQERKVSGLLQCAASALLATPDGWMMSPEEISYFVALGHALRRRLARIDETTAAA
jgi:hypothetical protein